MRQHGHHAHVLEDLVRCSVFTQGQSRVGSADFDVLARVGNGLPDLIVHPSCREVGKRSSKRNLTSNGHSGCDPHHVGFCDAHLEEPVWESLLETAHFQGPR